MTEISKIMERTLQNWALYRQMQADLCHDSRFIHNDSNPRIQQQSGVEKLEKMLSKEEDWPSNSFPLQTPKQKTSVKS
jgi:hypothetical protein